MITYQTLLDYSPVLMVVGIRAVRVGAIGLFGYYGIGYVERNIRSYLTKIYPDELRLELIARTVSYILLFVVLAALSFEFGFNIAALLGAAGIVGVAVAYAAQTSISNIISGLFLMIEKPFELGDTLLVAEQKGTVIAVNLFAITLQTVDGTVVRVPHEQLLKNKFTNITRLPVRRYTTTLKVAYQENPTKVIEIIKQVIRGNKHCYQECEPFVQLHELSGDYLAITVGAWAVQKNIDKVKNSLLIEIKEAFDKHSIVMAVSILGRYGKE